MTSDEKRQVFHDAIEILVERAVAIADIKTSAGAYASKTRAALREEHRPAAKEIFGAYDDLGTDIDAAQLADLLEPPKPKPAKKACPSCGSDTPAPPTPPTFTATDREPATDFDRARARNRIAQIRQSLKENAS